MFNEFLHNVVSNLFTPLLLFFYAGFLVPVLRVKLEFPKAVYQGLTIYLLLAIGWKGGEELARLEPHLYRQAAGFMLIGFFTNFCIGIVAYNVLRWTTRLRQVDAATVAGYYGSDSAGTFATCVGVLTAGNILSAPYMPVMLAIMEIPGCLVALYIVSQLRQKGMDGAGNMPGEAGYDPLRPRIVPPSHHGEQDDQAAEVVKVEELTAVAAGQALRVTRLSTGGTGRESRSSEIKADEAEAHLALQQVDLDEEDGLPAKRGSWLSGELLHEVFLNPGIYLLFSGILIGFISSLQGEDVTAKDDALFVKLFHGMLCVFLLEMGMTASKKLKDLKTAGWQFVAFAIIAPNIFAITGILVAHAYSMFLQEPFELGTYALFAVLCGASSYIAVPAVQRLAIPEASPTLPLAASLGVTFSYNVTIGIALYMLIASIVMKVAPVVSAAGGIIEKAGEGG